MSPPAPVVVSIGRGTCTVVQVAAEGAGEGEGAPRSCELSGDLARVQQTALAVGDRVVLQERPGAAPLVTEVLPRSSTLSRPDPMDPHIERVLVANVDDVVIVSSTRRPPFKAGLVDRTMVAVQHGGARPVVVVNKAELLDDRGRAALEEELSPYRELGLPVVLTSTVTGEGIGALRALLAGRTCAFVGHSGVGKSSLLNALSGQDAATTGRVREGDGKGRHTTTQAALHALPDGTRVVDTPGVRAFGLWGLDRLALRHYFPDLEGLGCRYGDCVHDPEPEADCAVKRAVAAGTVSAARYRTWLRLLREL